MSAAAEWNQGAVPCADSADVTLACHDHDLAARERLIENYIPLVKAIARRYAYTCEPYEDLVQAGVIDPTKVTRTALQNAASIASLMLTTEAMVCEIPEKKSAPAGGPGGHGPEMDY